MAKAIEQTPTLEGRDAERFLDILSKVDSVTIAKHEREVKEIVKALPKNLKL
mgnify:CR=1 FL=1